MMRVRRGIGLVELTVSVAILGLIMLVIAGLFSSGTKVKLSSDEEYEMQSQMRYTTDLITERIRYSSAVFILPESSFNAENIATDSYLTDYWDYFGIAENLETGKDEIVQYIYNKDNGRHEKKVLIEATDKLHLGMFFSEVVSDEGNVDDDDINRQIEYSIMGYRPEKGKDDPFLEIKSEAKALNSIHVRDHSAGSDSDPGVAIAFRSDLRDANVLGRVTLILDNSGSMGYTMYDNKYAETETTQRMYYVRNAAKMMLNKFSENENIDLCIITFDSTADLERSIGYDENDELVYNFNPYGSTYRFFNAQDNEDIFTELIDKMIPDGGTNTGDALRRANHVFKNAGNPGVNVTVREYLILVIDGDTRFATLDTSVAVTEDEYKNPPYLTKDGNAYDQEYVSSMTGLQSRYRYDNTVVNGFYQANSVLLVGNSPFELARQFIIAGQGVLYEDEPLTWHPIEYMKIIGDDIASRNLSSYIISVSPDVSTTGIKMTEEALHIDGKSTFNAIYEDDVKDHFEKVANEIVNDLWYVMGPKLYPES